jgi:hypothetical protein
MIHLIAAAALASPPSPLALHSQTTLHGEHGGTVLLAAPLAFEGVPADPCTTTFTVSAEGSIELGPATCGDANAYDVIAGLGAMQVAAVSPAEGRDGVTVTLRLEFLALDDGGTEVRYHDVNAPDSAEAEFVHWSEVRVKRRVNPSYPEAAKDLGLTEVHCKIRMKIDERGKPYEVTPESCPELFQQSATDAAWKWTFYPLERNGEPSKAEFVLNIIYRLR